MTCPACTGYGHRGYDRRERPLPCRKCRGTGRITPAEPQRPAPRRRPRMTPAELEAAYRDAAADPAYQAEMRGLARAWDATAGDGLSPFAALIP
jgi:hypothetical protein